MSPKNLRKPVCASSRLPHAHSCVCDYLWSNSSDPQEMIFEDSLQVTPSGKTRSRLRIVLVSGESIV